MKLVQYDPIIIFFTSIANKDIMSLKTTDYMVETSECQRKIALTIMNSIFEFFGLSESFRSISCFLFLFSHFWNTFFEVLFLWSFNTEQKNKRNKNDFGIRCLKIRFLSRLISSSWRMISSACSTAVSRKWIKIESGSKWILIMWWANSSKIYKASQLEASGVASGSKSEVDRVASGSSRKWIKLIFACISST